MHGCLPLAACTEDQAKAAGCDTAICGSIAGWGNPAPTTCTDCPKHGTNAVHAEQKTTLPFQNDHCAQTPLRCSDAGANTANAWTDGNAVAHKDSVSCTACEELNPSLFGGPAKSCTACEDGHELYARVQVGEPWPSAGAGRAARRPQ